MQSKLVPVLLAALLAALIALALLYQQKSNNALQSGAAPTQGAAPSSQPSVVASPVVAPSPGVSPVAAAPSPGAEVSPAPSGSPEAPAAPGAPPDLTVNANGLSKATVILTTSQGVVKFKFYSQDAPKTVQRIVQLISQGFYNGLIFHRVVPGFVIQGGDPLGNGTGGSGQKLKAEFNNRLHVEGAVAMARAADPDSADSQFYISLGVHPHLDRSYTVFAQVIEGMDAVRKIKVGDKIVSARIE